MTTIELRVPGLLVDATDGHNTVPLQAATLADAVKAISQQYPLLRPLVFDETGKLRPHVRLFFNGENLKWIDDHNVALKKSDQLEILQAVSGG